MDFPEELVTVSIQCQDYEETINFYCLHLNFHIIYDRILVDGKRVVLLGLNDNCGFRLSLEKSEGGQTDKASVNDGPVLLSINTSKCFEIYNSLREVEAFVVGKLKQLPHMQYFKLLDPNGYKIGVTEIFSDMVDWS